MKQLRVSVYATDPFTLTGVKVVLRPLPQIVVVNAADPGPVDVVIVAVERLAGEAQQLLRAAADTVRAPIVLITNEIDEAQLLPALKCRVAAIVSRAAADENELLRAIIAAASGASDLRPQNDVERLQREVLENRGAAASGLSVREVDVLRLMAEGLDTHQIGKELGYSERTIKNIIYAFTTRVRLRNRSHAVSYAMRTGVI
ncbi:LuxR C-terminal-related transcriptional regulator [Kribbella sp. NBC_01505]|uniref:helix-turn-helix transcriptional regulator n=1 Tax=Kribbella sp. NBC_01505 TaxID=2903580 RepID=UPI00386572F0